MSGDERKPRACQENKSDAQATIFLTLILIQAASKGRGKRMTKLQSKQPPKRDGMPENDNGLLDGMWAYFLHDYDNIEDDKFSVESDDETLSDNGYEGEELNEEEKKKSIVLASSLKRTVYLLEYARKLEAAKREKANEEKKTLDRDIATNKNRIAPSPENRENNLQDKTDTNPLRDGPPEVIYVQKDDFGDVYIDSAKTREVKKIPAIESPLRGREYAIDQKPYVHYEMDELTQKPKTHKDSNQMDENEIKAMKRKKLRRRIALLRLKAAKARMEKEDLLLLTTA